MESLMSLPEDFSLYVSLWAT